MQPAGKQPKRSRKKQLADLAAAKKKARQEAADLYTPTPEAEDDGDKDMQEMDHEEVGARSARGLRETVPISMSQDKSDLPAHLASREDLPVAPLYLQRRWARISRQYMAEYRKGADGCAAIHAVKALRSKRHRDTSDPRSRQVEAEMAALSGNM